MNRFTIPFNQPEIVGNELRYIKRAVELRNLAGDGPFTHACCRLLERRLGIARVLLTPSGTAALELAAMLCDLRPGDEVIMPSFTFVSTANAVMRLGARPIFVDVRPDTLNLDETLVEDVIGPRTRAIVPVHYAGISCEMDVILRLARKYGLRVIEDAAQGVGSTYKGRALGSIGDMGAFSFHETKNYTCGEGGALCLNDAALYERAVILWNKGTDKHLQLAGRVRKYQWIDVGGSYMPSELASAFLFAQLQRMDEIAERRRRAWRYYYENLLDLQDAGFLRLPVIPADCSQNHHLFYVLLRDEATRDEFEEFMAQGGIQTISHFEPLHSSPMGRRLGEQPVRLPVTESLAARLIRLPLFLAITEQQQSQVVARIHEYVKMIGRRGTSASPTVADLPKTAPV